MPDNSYSEESDHSRKYPLFRRNLKLEELYRKYQRKYNSMVIQRKYSRNDLLWVIAVFLLILSIPFIVNKMLERQNLISKAKLSSQAISFEAEHGHLSGNAIIDSSTTASGGKFVRFGPKGIIIDLATCPSLPTNTGWVTFEINVPQTNDYYFWSRIMALDETNNSFYLQIDNQCGIVIGDVPLPNDSWEWVNYRDGDKQIIVKLNLTAGSHNISLISREANLKVDRIILTTNTNCTPILKGDNCLL